MTENDVMEAARGLAEIVRETDVYREYLQQRDILKAQPGLYDQVNEYRQKNFDIQKCLKESTENFVRIRR